MAELADALGSGSSGRKAVRVQIPPSAPCYTSPQSNVMMLSILKLIITIFFLFLGYLQAYAFDSELWPGEGKPTFFSKTDTLILYKEPTIKSHIMNTLKTDEGEKIDFDMTRYRNIKPGIVKTKKSVTLTGKKLGPISYLSRSEYYSGKIPRKDYTFQKGDPFEYFQYRAEGSCIIRRKNEVYLIEYCPWLDVEDTQFTVEKEPVNEWWIRVTKGHKPLGWLLIDKSTVEEKRSF